jgi:hypothetical protein
MKAFSRNSLRSLRCAALAIALVIISNPAHAVFHVWQLQEVYTDSSGTLQFIEMFDPSGGQNSVGGQSIQVTDGVTTHTFTLPAGSLGGSTFNQTLLFGTAGIHAAGGPTPDYTIPNNFLFISGGTINFFGGNSGPYSALPTDGSLSRTWSGGNAVNSPKNYAGNTGVVAVPEPGTSALIVASVIGCSFWFRRRKFE